MTPGRAPLLLVSFVLAVAGCGDVRPPTAASVRLASVRADHPLPELRPSAPRPARGFLLAAPLWHAEAGRIRLRALPDGDASQHELRWSARGGALEADGAEAWLAPTQPDWTVTVQLARGSRVLSEATARPLPTVPTPRLTTRVDPLPLDPHACLDVSFPAQVAAGHLTCSDPDAPLLDELLPWGAPTPGPIPNLPRRTGAKSDPRIPPHRAATGAGLVAWAGESLGSWGGAAAGSVRWLPGRSTQGPPAVGPEHLVLVRSDRVELARHNRSQRSLVPARPREVPGSVAVHSPWWAVLEEGSPEQLSLHAIKGSRGAVVARPEQGADLTLDPRYLTWADGPRTRWLDLETGALRTATLGIARGRRSQRLGDWLLLHTHADESIAITALHLPTGGTETLLAARDLRLRGAGGGRATVASDGERAQLLALTLSEQPQEGP